MLFGLPLPLQKLFVCALYWNHFKLIPEEIFFKAKIEKFNIIWGKLLMECGGFAVDWPLFENREVGISEKRDQRGPQVNKVDGLLLLRYDTYKNSDRYAKDYMLCPIWPLNTDLQTQPPSASDRPHKWQGWFCDFCRPTGWVKVT